MTNFHKILVPTRFEGGAAVEEALRLVAPEGGCVVPLHVFPPMDWKLSLCCTEVSEPDWNWLTRAQRAEAERECRRSSQVRVRLESGSLGKTIVETAIDEGADLIVMEASGSPPWRRLLRSSTVAEVQRSAPCPVWVARQGCFLQGRPVRNVLCALALGPGSGRALSWANALATGAGATMTVVHVDPSPDPPLISGVSGDWQAALRAIDRARILELQDATGAATGPVLLESGDPVETVADVAAAIQADLVVIGRSPGVRPPLCKAYEFARALSCPVAAC